MHGYHMCMCFEFSSRGVVWVMDRLVHHVEIVEYLERMKGGEAMNPYVIHIEVWRYLGTKEIVWLAKCFNLIFLFEE